LILSIAFPYLADDIAFTEELAAKIEDFRRISKPSILTLTTSNPTLTVPS
jgi:hypothetical protein